jgi:hypothetical protein
MAVYVNSGIGSQIVMIPEATYGVAPALTGPTLMPVEFETEGLELKKTTAQGAGLHAGGLHNRAPRRKLTNYEAVGPMTLDLPTRYLNGLLKQMFGSVGQPLATMTQIGTSGVYSATHAPGPLKGVSMAIQKGVPSVDGAAPNPFTYVGMKLTDWEISVATGALAKLALTWSGRNELAGAFPNGGTSASGDPLNAATPALAPFVEAANNDVFYFREATLFTGTPTSGSAGGTALSSPPAVPATTVAVQSPYPYLTAVTITSGTLTSVQVNGVQVGTTAGTYAVPASGYVSITYTVAPTWTWFAGVTTLSSPVALGNIKTASVKYMFHYDEARYFLGSQGFKAEPIENNWRDISGQIEIEWLNAETMYTAFAADTPLAIRLDFVGPIIGSSGSNTQLMSLLVPAIYLDGEAPKVGGPAVVTQKLPYVGLDDGTNNPIQAVYQSIDTV